MVKDGEIQWKGMREASVTERELMQAIRSSGTEPDPSHVQSAYMERGGSICIVPRQEGPKILEVSVENGVQTVRIELQQGVHSVPVQPKGVIVQRPKYIIE